MDERFIETTDRRLERVERWVANLDRRLAQLDVEVARLGGKEAAAAGPSPARPAPKAALEVYCPNCYGGNSPTARTCLWCHKPMPVPGSQLWQRPAGSAAARPLLSTAVSGALPPPPPPPPPAPGFVRAAPAVEPMVERAQPAVRRIPVPAEVGIYRAFRVVQPAAPRTPVAAAILPPAGPVEPREAAPAAMPKFSLPSFDVLGKSEFWLNKVGIGLLLLGLAFFFKYSIDRGWLNEPVRIGLGLALGTVLLGFGLWLHGRRRHFSQVLLGGSVATYYITGYAAYEMFRLVPYEMAFGFMALVTALAFGLAVWRDSTVLSLIGVAGGLLTPFVLTSSATGVAGLITYTCVVLAGASAIYLFKGWRSLLWLAVAGGWAVFALAYLQAASFPGDMAIADRWALQAAALFGVLAFWAVPVLREALYARNPDRWPYPRFVRFSGYQDIANTHVYWLVITVPLITLGFSRLTWSTWVSEVQWGWLTLAGTALYALAAWVLRKDTPRLAYTHVMMAILLVSLGLVQILDGDALIFALAVEATALHFVAWRLSDRGTSAYGHIISTIVVAWLALRMEDTLFLKPGLDAPSLTNLAIIALLAAASFVVQPKTVLAGLYRIAVHVGVVGWLFQQLYVLPEWQAWVMLAWAAYSIGLGVLYWRLPSHFPANETGAPANLIFAATALLFAWRIGMGHEGELAVLNVKTLVDAVLVAAAVGVSFIAWPERARTVYRLAAHAGVLALLFRELQVLDNGFSYVMVAWAAYGLFMHYLSTRLTDEYEAGVVSRAAALPYLGAAGLFANFVVSSGPELAVVNIPALGALATIGLTTAVVFVGRSRLEAAPYLLAVHAGVMAFLWHELRVLDNGLSYVMLTWAAYGLFMHYLSTRLADPMEARVTSLAAAVPYLGAAGLFVRHLYGQPADLAIFNIPALAALAGIGLTAAVVFFNRSRMFAVPYLLAAHVAVLSWLAHELWPLEHGNAFVTIAWGAYAIALLVWGLWGQRNMPLVYTGLATLFLVVGKLFLVDLSEVDPLWRVLLFIGFGGVFLLLSYFFQNLIRGGPSTGSRLHHPGSAAR